MTEIVNLTPHAVTLRTPDGDRTFPPSGTVARVATTQVEAEHSSGLPCARRQLGEVTGLPAGDTLCIVSTMAFDAAVASGRDCSNLLVPDSGPDAFRSGPDSKVLDALSALARNAEWADDGMPCSGRELREALKVFEALAARQQGQIEAVRRFGR